MSLIIVSFIILHGINAIKSESQKIEARCLSGIKPAEIMSHVRRVK